jgi:hypothetical protein
VLDWTARPSFLGEFETLLAPIPVRCPASTRFMPRGYEHPDEARLESFGPSVMPDLGVWNELEDWWLVHKARANTPNWDIAVFCEIERRPGLVLVEAKANWPELGRAGKREPNAGSQRSIENHDRIASAIGEAQDGWRVIDSRVSISRDSHYQLANRLAFTWKLGTLGIPVVLLYLGFTGDEGIRDAGEPFTDDADWRTAFSQYADGVVPLELFERRHDLGAAPVWLSLRGRDVIEESRPVS